MRVFAIAIVSAAGIVGVTGDVQAQGVGGSYDVKFEEVQNSCRNTGMNLRRTTVKLKQKRGTRVDVTLPMVPVMSGKVKKGGKFKAEAKRGGTSIRGVDGRFSIAGRVQKGVLQFVFIAEYYRGKRPLCTQSWNGTGTLGSS